MPKAQTLYLNTYFAFPDIWKLKSKILNYTKVN
jgi:hypothetical protein